MERKSTLFHISAGVVLAMFIISAAVTLALNFRFIYYADMDRYDLCEVSGLTEDELKQDYNTLIDYNCIWGPEKLEFAHFTLSPGASQHFAEARVLFLFFGWGTIAFGLMSVILILIAKKRALGAGYLMYAAAISVLLPVLLGAFALLAWDRLFVLFHEISFGNDLWLFDPAVDPIINVLPDQFFFHEAMAIFGLVIAGGLILAAAYRRISRAASYDK